MNDQQVTDCELIERIAQGDEDAFNALHVRYKRRVMGFIYRRLSLGDQRRGLVEDLSQESWLRIYLSASQYRPEYKAPWWVFQQVKRVIQDKIEKQTAMKRDVPVYSLSGPIIGKD